MSTYHLFANPKHPKQVEILILLKVKFKYIPVFKNIAILKIYIKYVFCFLIKKCLLMRKQKLYIFHIFFSNCTIFENGRVCIYKISEQCLNKSPP